MTESSNTASQSKPSGQPEPEMGSGPTADETFTWADDTARGGPKGGGTAAADILESVRVAMDDLAERAGPTVRELSARAAELTAVAADRAAPLARRAGEVTAEVSGKLAARSREWASELRSSTPAGEPAGEPTSGEARDPAGSAEQG